ncbi:MAG: glycosyltransferase family 2 protein [Prochlorococcus marinus CUG1438]|nr:glycosyltransferase family 2 protein [Prochlorococcus marinus CUG1438]
MNNNNLELISIIIPCFNSGETLERTINSVYNQTWKNKEIVLVNDGSSDKYTLEIIKKLKDNLYIKVLNQENLGLPAARNNGAKYASGNFLYFIDSDDWLELDALELMYQFYKLNHQDGFVFSDIIIEGKINKIIKKEYNFFEQLFLNQLPYSIFISRENWIKYGGYDEKMKLGYEDWEFNIRLGSQNQYGIRLPQPLFHYNVSNSGMLLSKTSKYHAQIVFYIMNKNKEIYKLKNLLKIWFKWRRKESSFPTSIYFLWYLILKLIPNALVSKLFIISRNFKWFFTRNKILHSIKNFRIL